MKQIRTILCLAATAFSLAACSYFDTSGQEGSGEVIDLTTATPQAVQASPLPPDDLSALSRTMTGGSVEVYPLDGPPADMYAPSSPDMLAPSAGTMTAPGGSDGFSAPQDIDVQPVPIVPLMAPDNLGIPSYPGVEVYPLEGGMAAASMSPSEIAVSRLDHGGGPLTPMPSPPGGGGASVFYFDNGSAALRPDDESILAELARSYRGGGMVSVNGYASAQSSIDDPVKRRMANLKISMERALAAVKALIEAGIPPENIETKAYGEAPPRGSSPMGGDDSSSRRVEIYGLAG